MRGDYWVTKGGIVVQQTESAEIFRGDAVRAVCARVETGRFHGRLRLDRLRPATKAEVREAMNRRKGRR